MIISGFKYHFTISFCLITSIIWGQFAPNKAKNLTITVEEAIPDTVLRKELESLTVFSEHPKFKLNEKIKTLKKLKSLSILIEGNEFVLPNWIGELTQLEELYCKWNINNVPESIGNLSNLKALSLIGNFKSIPNSIVNCKNLEYLNIEGRGMKTFPIFLYDLKNLGFLAFTNTNIQSLPEGVNSLSYLEYLDLGSNELISLPTSLAACERLIEINLHENKLPPYEYIKLKEANKRLIIKYDYRFQKFVINMNYQFIKPSENNKASSVKEALKKGRKCEILDLSNHPNIEKELVKIRKYHKKLEHISVLKLSGNKLEKIPIEIGKLSGLKELYLDDNNLIDLPEFIINMESLRVLSISKNQIGALPLDILRMHHLNKFVLDDVLINNAFLQRINNCMPFVKVIYQDQ